MISPEQIAKLSRKLTGALHHAPQHPEQFVNVTGQLLQSNGLAITDLSIVVGKDLVADLDSKLQQARRNAPPTFDNLIDLARTRLGAPLESKMAKILGVSSKAIAECKRLGHVPRAWFEKINALPELDETTLLLDADIRRVVRILANNAYSPEDIHKVFQQIRITRAGVGPIARAIFGDEGCLDVEEFAEMQHELFRDADDAEIRFRIWLTTQLGFEFAGIKELGRGLNTKQIERIRSRFRQEIKMRESDPAYYSVAVTAELIDRPRRGNSTRSNTAVGDEGELRAVLDRIFPDGADDRRTRRLAQLTGLGDRHTLDLLKGANSVAPPWWDFLRRVEAAMSPPSHSSTHVATSGVQPASFERVAAGTA